MPISYVDGDELDNTLVDDVRCSENGKVCRRCVHAQCVMIRLQATIEDLIKELQQRR